MRSVVSGMLLAVGSSTTLVAGAGCTRQTAAPGNLRVWAVPEQAAVFDDAAPEPENEIFSEANHLIRLDAAVNEAVSFQMVLSSEGDASSITAIKIDDLRQGERSIPAERVRMYRVGWVPVDDYPAWYLRLTPYLRQSRRFPDPLIPLIAPKGALPLLVSPGRREIVWVEIHVPPGTEAGLYRSAITIDYEAHGAAEGGRGGSLVSRTGSRANLLAPSDKAQPLEIALSLNVWSFALPQTRHLALMAGVDTAALVSHHLEIDGRRYSPSRLSFDDPAYKQATSIIDATIRLLHEHRCSSMLRDVQPLRRVGSAGQFDLDWADYDRLVTGVLDGSAFEDRAAAVAWPLPIDEREPDPQTYNGWGSPAYENMLVEYLRQCVAHFKERGWLDRHYLWMQVPGENRRQKYQQFERLGQWVKQADPRINLVCNLTPQSMAPYGWRNDPFIDVSRYVGTWCPPASLCDPNALARQRAAGKATWLWPDRPPYAGSLSLIAPPTHALSIPWQAYRFELGGVMLPVINDWAEDGASEQALIWPGKPYGLNGPIPSIRLKRLFRGAQDYEYLWLLERNRRPAIARTVAAGLFAYGGTECYGEHLLDGLPHGWVTDPAAWGLARRLMARELTSAMTETGGNAAATGVREDVAAFEKQIEWARLTQAVRQVRAKVEGVRVRMKEEDKTTPLRIEATLSLFNATRQPFTGTPAFPHLPEGWSADEAPAPIQNLEPLHSARRLVRARAASIEPNDEGILPIPLWVTAGAPLPQPTLGRLSLLTSQRLARPPAIDGRLDDWPLGAGNVAGDFVLVGALDVPKEGRPSPDSPSQGTTVFVCHDDNYLYIAFNCQDDRLKERAVPRSNTVRYEDLWPVGEELLEVVLDPTGRAVEPGDVLHILVKANGAVIAEHGAPCLTHVAENKEWAVNVGAAVDDQSQKDRWTAEIRIPLSSLGKRPAVWGINFGRFQARLGEYSSWSGARQYLYSPVSLGNIRLDN